MDAVRPRGVRMTVRVVVAEDHPLVREGVVAALRRDAEIDVVGMAEDGLAAMELASEHQPDVVVLDLSLPRLDGVGVLERLRLELPRVRALVLTANESQESVLGALDAGAAGYLSKRTTAETLCRAVRTVHGGGSVIAPDLAGHLLRAAGRRPADASGARALLEDRELEVVRLVAEGLTDTEIAERLYLSPRTVQNDLSRVREKTGLRRRQELARWAAEHDLA
jgi:DNA-binding NarL/FixJ family response regulator